MAIKLHLIQGAVSTQIIWNSFPQICLFPPCIYFFNSLSVALWTHRYLFYSLWCDPMLHYLICCTNCFHCGHGSSFGLFAFFSLTYSHHFIFWALPYFQVLQDSPGSFSYFIFHISCSDIFPRSLVPFFGRILLETKTWVLDGFFYVLFWCQFCKEGIGQSNFRMPSITIPSLLLMNMNIIFTYICISTNEEAINCQICWLINMQR